MREVLLVRFGEVHLKGQNRPYFLKTLTENVRRAVKPLGGQVWLADSRIYVAGVEDMRACGERVRRVFGVYSVSPAWELPKEFDVIAAKCVEMMRSLSGSFKVFARRSDKHFPMNSMEMATEIGGRVLETIPSCMWTSITPNIASTSRSAITPMSASRNGRPWAACPWARAARRRSYSPAASTAPWPAIS